MIKKNNKAMKTSTVNIRIFAKKCSITLIALSISAGLFSQKSVLKYEIQQFTNNVFSSTEEILSAFSFSYEETMIEEDVRFEDWMMDLEKWATKMDSMTKKDEKETLNSKEVEFTEDQIDFESWMFDSNWLNESKHFNHSEKKEINTESELQLEAWMSKPGEWSVTELK